MNTILHKIIHHFENIFSLITGPKVLLIDENVKSMLSRIFVYSDLRKFEIFSIHLLDGTKKIKIPYIPCIIIYSGGLNNNICYELRNPSFESYYIFSLSKINNEYINYLARSDIHNKIKKINEISMNITPISSKSCIISNNLILRHELKTKNIAEYIFGLLSILEYNPYIIYHNNIKSCRNITKYIKKIKEQSNNSLFSQDNNSVLILIDRKNDLLTPFLTHWNYDSLIHEYFPIDGNIVKISNNNKELLFEKNDSFYRENRFKHIDHVSKNNKLYSSSKHEKIIKIIENKLELHKISDLSSLKSEIIKKNITLQQFIHFINTQKYKKEDLIHLAYIYTIVNKNYKNIQKIHVAFDNIGIKTNSYTLDKITTILGEYEQINISNIINSLINKNIAKKYELFEDIDSITPKAKKNIIIFVNGGITYEEISIVENTPYNITLMSTHITNNKNIFYNL